MGRQRGQGHVVEAPEGRRHSRGQQLREHVLLLGHVGQHTSYGDTTDRELQDGRRGERNRLPCSVPGEKHRQRKRQLHRYRLRRLGEYHRHVHGHHARDSGSAPRRRASHANDSRGGASTTSTRRTPPTTSGPPTSATAPVDPQLVLPVPESSRPWFLARARARSIFQPTPGRNSPPLVFDNDGSANWNNSLTFDNSGIYDIADGSCHYDCQGRRERCFGRSPRVDPLDARAHRPRRDLLRR